MAEIFRFLSLCFTKNVHRALRQLQFFQNNVHVLISFIFIPAFPLGRLAGQ